MGWPKTTKKAGLYQTIGSQHSPSTQHWLHVDCQRFTPKNTKEARFKQTIGSQHKPSTHIGPMWIASGLPKKTKKRSEVISIHWSPTQAINPPWPHEDGPRLGQKNTKNA